MKKFEKGMPEYESMLFPLGMMFPFVDIPRVLGNIRGWACSNGSRVLVVAGEKDKLMGGSLMERLAGLYRKSFFVERTMKLEEIHQVPVTFEVVEGSGHHIQNDLYWEDGARKILKFLEQL